MKNPRIALFLAVAAAVAGGCARAPDAPEGAETTPTHPTATENVAVIDERWISSFDLAENIDSVAVSADHGWVVATTKGTHQLLVLDADTGELVRRVGDAGSDPGQFLRPNGLAVVDDLVLVVERDNHRVQVLELPGFRPVGFIGADLLERPYGIAVRADDPGATIWVTDNFDLPAGDPSGNPRLAERVKVFRFARDGDGLASEHVASFGELDGPGAMWKVETIAADPTNDVLLIAEETPERMGLLVYTLDGVFTGRVVGAEIFTAEPEGVGLWTDGDDGWWVATDQHKARSVFHLFDRTTLEHKGAFSGGVTANTDGIVVFDLAIGVFDEGGVIAVHDDQGVTAFDWRSIRTAAGLP